MNLVAVVKTVDYFKNEFDLEVSENDIISETDLIVLLTNKLLELQKKSTFRMIDLLYKLDVDPGEIFTKRFENNYKFNFHIAECIVSRQKEKILSRLLFPQKSINWKEE